MEYPAEQNEIREAVGAFSQPENVRQAVKDLLHAGFDRAELGLLAGENIVETSLSDLYVRANPNEADSDAPRIAFVSKESTEDTNHAGLGALAFLGAAGAAGAAVITAGIFGGALLTGAAGVAAVGAVGAIVGTVISKSDADQLEEQVDEGHILLFVRTTDAESERVAMEALAKNGAIEPKVYSVPAPKTG